MSLATQLMNLDAVTSPGAVPAKIWKARRYILEHSEEGLSLTAVARFVNISPNHLSEKFKEVTGVKFVEYIARRRFANACRLLQKPELRISEIAFEVGFQSLSQFNRVFRRFSGKSPTEYRTTECPCWNGSSPDAHRQKTGKFLAEEMRSRSPTISGRLRGDEGHAVQAMAPRHR